MDWKKELNRWKEEENIDGSLKEQLELLDEAELEDAFYKELEFGTGGMRGKLGPGTNRMNVYTVRKAAKGLAEYVKNKKGDSIVIAYDSRYLSETFAVETARVAGAEGVKAYVFSSLRPTPELSFAVRHLGADAGVVITASHNPPEYNGFKVYNEDGGQLPPAEAEKMITLVQKVENELEVDTEEAGTLEENGLLAWVDTDVDEAYLEAVQGIRLSDDIDKDMSIIFTPLHGTAHPLVTDSLKRAGFTNVSLVEAQAEPDPEFSTVASPNPEETQAFTLAMEKGQKTGAELLIATDPDADRVGLAVPGEDGEYRVLNGNQTGALMLDYILSQNEELPDNKIMIKTIVTSEMGRAIASKYGARTLDTLTGFKFIGEKIREFEASGEATFAFGYEESYGYLVSSFVRDKDAVQASLMGAEMAAHWKKKGYTLLEALEELYKEHGYYIEGMDSLKLEGRAGTEKIARIVDSFRETELKKAGGLEVLATEDYQSSERIFADGTKETIHLPKSNVVKFILEEDGWFCLRPSGTEPKLKCYYGVKSGNRERSKELLEALRAEVSEKWHAVN
ncbi:phosphoglucomutase [Salimicrobium jeotgali]|uniref:Phosphoglucomutase n=1 Tax=Salimicrobium jeotgali TaxID=1230341 RepID=K2GFE6_9BACI|nr:phospho-sugar mutase [Salimicrobium jeotgali]AKG03879.1 phosphoglucomutase [Salimicrobium jeotgali]EKE32907.1 phosphoglucomutase [Salimicrobium jeotgali]MBM7695099.1 phosphoglucomutase [Salimicrobium jeotgali]